MIDLTKDVSPAVLAETAAKLEAEHKAQEEDEAKRDLDDAINPFRQRLVRSHKLSTLSLLKLCFMVLT